MSENIGSNVTDEYNNNEPQLEQIFNVIQWGNDATDITEWWPAADHYMNACESLSVLLTKSTTKPPRHHNDDQEKLQQLYQEQINFYYQKTRSCIIQGLQQQQQEQDESEQRPNVTTTNSNNQSDYQYQFNILYRFYNFYYPITMPPPATTIVCNNATTHTTSHDHGNVQDTTPPPVTHHVNGDDYDTTCQLEERLRQLNATLPTHLKSEEEILRQRQEQLRRIGVPEVPGPVVGPIVLYDTMVPEKDPVAAIIAQMTEQVQWTPHDEAEEAVEDTLAHDLMEQLLRDATTSEDDPDDADAGEDDEDEDDDDDDDDDGKEEEEG